MRFWLGACVLAMAGWAQAGDGVHRRGDFRFEIAPMPAYVVEHPVAERWDAAAPGVDGATWRVWLYDRQVDRRGAKSSFFVDYAYEARTTSLLGDAGKYQITFNPEYQQLAIHRVQLRRDGRWSDRLDPDRISLARRESGFENDMADGAVTALIVLDDVRVDDVVRVAYTIHGSNPILDGQDSDTMYFAWQSPLLDARMRLLDDPDTTLDVRRENGAPEPMRRQSADAVELEMRAHGAAAIVDESNYPVWYQPYPRAQASATRSWADVVAWALPLYPAVTAPLPPDLEMRVAQWSRLPNQSERLTAALRAVQDEVRYFGVEMGDNTHRPVAPAQTWTRRRGDCKDKAYLLATLLGRLGVPSVPALASTDEGKAVEAMVPSAYDFNHVIVRSLVDGKPVWVDPTISQQGGQAVASDLSRYGVVLPIAPGQATLETVVAPAGGDAGTEVVERYHPAAAGPEVALEIRTVYKGMTADARRASFASERLSDVSRRYADYYRKRFGELSPVGEPQVQDDRRANVMTVVEHYRLAAPLEAEGGAVSGLSVRADAIEAPATLPSTMDRRGPLRFAVPGLYRHQMRVDVPPGWKPTFGSGSESVQGKYFGYSRDVRIAGNEVVLAYELDVRELDIPGKDAATHVGQLRKVQDTLGATLRFRVPQDSADEDRARRLRELLRGANGGQKP